MSQSSIIPCALTACVLKQSEDAHIDGCMPANLVVSYLYEVHFKESKCSVPLTSELMSKVKNITESQGLTLGWTTQLAWSPRIAQLAASSAQGVFLHTLTPQGIFKGKLPSGDHLWRSVAYSDDGFHIAGGADEGIVWRWRVEPGHDLDQHRMQVDGDVSDVTFMADRRLLVVASKRLYVFGHDLKIDSTHELGAHDLTTVAAHGAVVACAGWGGAIHVWQNGLHAAPTVWPYHTERVNQLIFSPDASMLCSVGRDGAVVVWSVADGRILTKRDAAHGDENGVDCASFSPDGSLLATGGRDGALRIWDPLTLSPVKTISEHKRPVIALAWRPDGKMLASGSGDHHIRLWRFND